MRFSVVISVIALGAAACSKGAESKKANPNAADSASVTIRSANASEPTPPPRPEPKRPMNVLLIMIDSMRWDMPWAGYSRPIAPWLTKFAEKSVLYPRGYSISSYTAKSVAPALVGKYPSEMSRDGYFFTTWGRDDNLFVSERAQKAGHRTMAGHGHGYFKALMGLDQGFDDYRLLPGTELDITGVANITGESLNGLAKKMLADPKNARADGKRFFAYFHFLDPHYTYFRHKSCPDWGTELRDLYDSEICYSDQWVGNLVDWVLEQPWGAETAIIITADHGEGFGERGRNRHAYDVWESLVRVPIIFHIPGADARRIETPRGHIDLAPTIADLMGLPSDPPFRGKSLVPEIFGDKVDPRPVVVDLPRCDIMDRRRGVVDGDYKIIAFGEDSEWMLFNVKDDPKEETDLSEKEPEKLAAMKELYSKISKDIPITPVFGLGPALKGAPDNQRW